MHTASLYERLGGAPGVAALVDEIVSLHMVNPTICARFRPFLATPDRLAVVKTHLQTFLAAGSGGPDDYRGRPMVEAHRGMNISAEEYMAALDDIMLALRKREIDEQTQNDVLAIAYSLKGEIIRV